MNLRKYTPLAVTAFLFTLLYSITVFAAVEGNIESVTDKGITGWAWNSDSPDEIVSVELQIFNAGSDLAAKTVTLSANEFNENTAASTDGGSHSFTYPVNWTGFDASEFQVKAYAVSEGTKTEMKGISEYSKPVQTTNTDYFGSAVSHVAAGPGFVKVADQPEEPEKDIAGNSLGIFSTTAYCRCSICSSGHNITYAGTVPTINHTISADIRKFPLGTKLMIDGTVYTVEDIGSSIVGNKLDIFFGSHQEALEYGVQKVEVFSVNEDKSN